MSEYDIIRNSVGGVVYGVSWYVMEQGLGLEEAVVRAALLNEESEWTDEQGRSMWSGHTYAAVESGRVYHGEVLSDLHRTVHFSDEDIELDEVRVAGEVRELISGMEGLNHHGREARAALVLRLADTLGLSAEVVEEDGTGEAVDGAEGLVAVVSYHTLTLAGHSVAEWSRCSVGGWGGECGQLPATAWSDWEDTDGGEHLPEHVSEVLEVLGLEDTLPDVPEPEEPDEVLRSEAGAALWHHGWQSGGWSISTYYRTLGEAQVAARACERGFEAANPTGYGHYWAATAGSAEDGFPEPAGEGEGEW